MLKEEESVLAEPECEKAGNAEVPVILFVCTGNTCRSPMAEAVFCRDYAKSGYTAQSAGLFADGTPISENAASALAEAGYKASAKHSRPVTSELIERSALIVGITASHAARLIMSYPEYASKIVKLPIDIDDPFGGDIQVYRKCLDEIKKALALLACERGFTR